LPRENQGVTLSAITFKICHPVSQSKPAKSINYL
jgi:hypothetical protein